MKKTPLLFVMVLIGTCNTSIVAQDKTEMTKADAKSMIKTLNPSRYSVHDPSITWDETSQTYYIFGSHRAAAKTKDLHTWTEVPYKWASVNADGSITNDNNNQTAFRRPQVKTVTIDGKEVAMPEFNAEAWSHTYQQGGAEYNVNGNMWAPDIIYNPVMKKWCMYMSINGDNWASSIILLTADKVEGPYVYQAPVMITGFLNETTEGISYKKTDMELALGELKSLPARYRKPTSGGGNWGEYWPNCIDPTVFYDEEGKLWMAYGSWSGGIWIIELDENTGLRDYNVKYGTDYDQLGRNATTDGYFGKRIAGGHYVSGEGPYIEHIGEYYYLFMSYGGLDAVGGYDMRVFRSKNPDGPYLDPQGNKATVTGYELNYGLTNVTRGEKLMTAFGGWGENMEANEGENAQGHNSVLHHTDGNTYLVYHTRFHDLGEWHQVRVRQLFVNKDGWLVAAPFEYWGETVNDETIKTRQLYADSDIPGAYKLLTHKYRMDHKNKEEVLPVDIQLNEDGTITGELKGKWETEEGTSYITIYLNGVTYKGVCIDQQMYKTTARALCFTAANNKGVNIWGYKTRDDYQLARQLNKTTLPVTYRKAISESVDLYNIDLLDGVTLNWTSETPSILSDGGRYNPAGLTADSLVDLAVRMDCGKYYYADTITVNVKAETIPEGDWFTGIRAYYNFDSEPILNAYNDKDTVALKRSMTTKVGYLTSDSVRNGQVLHLNYGEKARRECYAVFNNPLNGADMTDGVTVAFWLNCTTVDNDLAALFSFYNSKTKATLCLAGNSYIYFNDKNSTKLDINHPDTLSTVVIPSKAWTHVAMTISRKDGITYYVDGAQKYTERYKGDMDGTVVSKESQFDFNKMIDHIATCPEFYLGYGGDNGTAEADYDDLLVYDRVLASDDIKGMKKIGNREYSFYSETVGIESPTVVPVVRKGIYDLAGRRLTQEPERGFYIMDGKKYFKK